MASPVEYITVHITRGDWGEFIKVYPDCVETELTGRVVMAAIKKVNDSHNTQMASARLRLVHGPLSAADEELRQLLGEAHGVEVKPPSSWGGVDS